jgi:ribosomal protein S8
MRDNSEVKTSKLEDKFEQLMVDMGLIKDVHYIKNHLVVNIKTFFDFYLPNHNIIIEVDGDFYHCNPTTHPIPVYEIQKKNTMFFARIPVLPLSNNLGILSSAGSSTTVVGTPVCVLAIRRASSSSLAIMKWALLPFPVLLTSKNLMLSYFLKGSK